MNNTTEVSLDVYSLKSGIYGIHVEYEDNELSGILLSILTIK